VEKRERHGLAEFQHQHPTRARAGASRRPRSLHCLPLLAHRRHSHLLPVAAHATADRPGLERARSGLARSSTAAQTSSAGRPGQPHHAAPAAQPLRADVVALHNVQHARARRKSLVDDPCLIVLATAAPNRAGRRENGTS
jgi:hypothetical protein